MSAEKTTDLATLAGMLPSSFSQTAPNTPAYLMFPKAGSETWMNVKASIPDAQSFEPVIKLPSGRVVRAGKVPWRFACYYLTGAQFWTQVDNAFSIVAASDREQEPPYAEHTEAVLIVLHPDEGFLPVRVTFRKGTAPIGRRLDAAIRETLTTEWASANPATLESVLPNFRFIAEVSIRVKTSTQGAGAGNPYATGDAKIVPANAKTIAEVSEWAKNPGDLTRSVLDAYTRRVEEIRRKIVTVA